MVQREVSKIDPHIEKATEVGTSRGPSIVVGLDPEEILPTIPLSWAMAKHSCKTQRSEMPLQVRFGEGDSFTLDVASNPYV